MRYKNFNTKSDDLTKISDINRPISYIKDIDNNRVVCVFDFNCQELNKMMAQKACDYLNEVY